MTPEPLDFWNYPHWANASADHPDSPDYRPIWLRAPYIPPLPPPPPPRKPARIIGAKEPLGWDCGTIRIEMPEGLKHVVVSDHTWAFLVVRSSGILYRGAKLTIRSG